MTPLHTNHQVTIHCLTYNHAPYIEDAMNGFCLQETTFPFLAIICDDASTDGEQDVIRKYLQEHFNTSSDKDYQSWETEEAKIVFAQHKTNSNCSFLVIFLKTNYYSQKKDKSHLWKEWEESAKYIALCEGDDYWTHPLKLQKQVDFLEKHPDYSLAVHDFKVYENQNHRFRTSHPIHFLNESKDNWTLSINDYKKGLFFTQTLTAVYRYSALQKSLYSNYEAKFDMTLFYAILTQGKCILINRVMGVYRTHPESMTSGKNSRMFHDIIDYKLLKMCEIEGSRDSKDFVYNYLRPLALTEILNKRWNVLLDSFKYLGFRRGFSLSILTPFVTIINIIMRKIQKGLIIKNV